MAFSLQPDTQHVGEVSRGKVEKKPGPAGSMRRGILGLGRDRAFVGQDNVHKPQPIQRALSKERYPETRDRAPMGQAGMHLAHLTQREGAIAGKK